MRSSIIIPFFAGLLAVTSSIQAQNRPAKSTSPKAKTTSSVSQLPEFSLSRAEVEAHIRFLASDELQGRKVGEPGNWIAARYIAEQFRQLGLKPAATVAGKPDYLQPIDLERIKAANSATMLVGKDTLHLGKELVVMAGGPTNLSGEVVYVGYGLTDGEDGYKGRDVKGRILVAQGGSPDAKSPREIFSASAAKRKLASEKGAAALIELYSESIPWGFVNQYFNREQLSIPVTAETSAPIAHLWVNNANNKYKQLKELAKRLRFKPRDACGHRPLGQCSGDH